MHPAFQDAKESEANIVTEDDIYQAVRDCREGNSTICRYKIEVSQASSFLSCMETIKLDTTSHAIRKCTDEQNPGVDESKNSVASSHAQHKVSEILSIVAI